MALVVFDLDDTLIDRTSALRRWAEAFCAERGRPSDDVDWIVETDGLVGQRDRERWAAMVAERFGISGSPAGLRERWHAEYLERYVIDAPAAAALARLRSAGHRIGIATNGPPSQVDKITRNGLDGMVDGYVVSDLVGARKPEREIFEAVARECACGLDGGWMVGDSAPADMAGGRAAGLVTVWLHRGRSWDDVGHLPDPWAVERGLDADPPPAGWRPDHEVDSVPGAVELILGRA